MMSGEHVMVLNLVSRSVSILLSATDVIHLLHLADHT